MKKKFKIKQKAKGLKFEVNFQERYGQDWAFSQLPPVSGPAIMTVPPGGLQPRIPGQQGSARLTASARQAYDEYMQDRLRQNQQIPAPVGGPRPKHTVVEVSEGFTVQTLCIKSHVILNQSGRILFYQIEE